MRLLILLALFQAPAPAPAVITNTTVIDVATGRLEAGRTVLIRDGRVVEVGPAGTAAPSGITVVDGTGKYLIPGLWDMHVHAAFPGLDQLFLPLLVANGVTGARDMFSQISQLDSARTRVGRGALVGPRLIGSGNLVDGVPPIWPGSRSVRTPEDARRAVDSLARAGAGFIKVYSRLSPEAYRAIAAEAKRVGITFAGHVPSLVSAAEASDLGQRTIEHLTNLATACSSDEAALLAEVAAVVSDSARGWNAAGPVQLRQVPRIQQTYDPARCRELARRFIRNDTWIVPTMVVLRSVSHLDDITLASDPRLVYIPSGMSRGWNPRVDFRFRSFTPEVWAVRKTVYARQREIISLLRSENVRFLAGTDLANPYIFPGFSLHDELGLMVEAGFTPLQALQAATLEPARFLGAADSMGTVAAGKVADLVLLDANPLDDIRNISRVHAVIAAGRLYRRPALDSLLAEGRKRAGGR
jgi:imidazolonepropionase-like amidohydrolase